MVKKKNVNLFAAFYFAPTVRSMFSKRDLAALETALHSLIIPFSSEDANTDGQLTTETVGSRSSVLRHESLEWYTVMVHCVPAGSLLIIHPKKVTGSDPSLRVVKELGRSTTSLW